MGDLLRFYPRAYDDYRRVYSLREAVSLPSDTPVVVRGTVVRVHRFFRRLLDVHIESDGATLRARWFRPNAGMVKSYARGAEVALAGNLRRTPEGGLELIHPSNVTALASGSTGVGIRPRYPVIEKVPGRTVEKLVEAALGAAGADELEILPDGLRRRLGLPRVVEALAFVHRPPDGISVAELADLRAGKCPAQRRLAFEEIFVAQVGLALERMRCRSQPALACGRQWQSRLLEVEAALPFSLTCAQQRAIESVFAAMVGAAPMQCLLQGDVGSGKTAVAFAAMLQVARAGGQTLLMAPTTVLAEQHHRTMLEWGDRVGLRIGLLHAALPAAERRQLLTRAQAGAVDVVIGTHALIEDRLQLHRLGLAVVDEQHRFGVRQRAMLRRVGGRGNDWKIGAQKGMVPHLLVLSATPIPRSLALTLYGDLDVLTLDVLPPGRKPVITHLGRGSSARETAYESLRACVASGGQGFVVCPAIAESIADRRPTSTVALARRLRRSLAPARIGVLHGQIASQEQQSIVAAFRAREIDVLVATTVVEVGVDVPSASMMIVEDADRFGLAQLHQLRGRVGRGHAQAYCWLLTNTDDPDALDRLRVIAEVSDGFRIAEEDLRRRGAGDLHGTRQAGMPALRFADLGAYLGLVELARHEASALVDSDPGLALSMHAPLAQAVREWAERARPIGEEAG